MTLVAGDEQCAEGTLTSVKSGRLSSFQEQAHLHVLHAPRACGGWRGGTEEDAHGEHRHGGEDDGPRPGPGGLASEK